MVKIKKYKCGIHGEHIHFTKYVDLDKPICAICLDLSLWGGWYEKNPEKAKKILSKDELMLVGIW